MIRNRIKLILLLVAATIGTAIPGVAARKFVHPGLSYTQGQLDRMRAMVEAKVEPYYTTFQNLKNSRYSSLDRTVRDRGTSIPSGKTQDYVGIDGRCAHDLALLWKLSAFFIKAYKILNFT